MTQSAAKVPTREQWELIATDLEWAHRAASPEPNGASFSSTLYYLRRAASALGLRVSADEPALEAAAAPPSHEAELVKALRDIANYSPASTIQPVAIAREALAALDTPAKDERP